MVSRTNAKGRIASGRGAASPAPASRGRFSVSSASSGSLSYLYEDPDFSSLSDPNLTVWFKNLLKKDNTTRSKALLDLIQYTQAHPNEKDGGLDDVVLETWVRIFPRISIDNDRIVRELSHSLLLYLLKSARKRLEKNISKIAGAWLAGTFDRERTVARSASEGLSTFLNTEEKVTQFWRKCQPQVLQYAIDAVIETPDTLSDERSTNPEDAQAKYYRVIGASFFLVHGLLQRLPEAETKKYHAAYAAFFSTGPGDCVWSFVTADDSHTRKMVYRLLQLCMEKRQELIEPHSPRIGRLLTSDALKSSQRGSAVDLVTLLIKMTNQNAQLWAAKKSPLSRLRGFVERGSQGGPPIFWQGIDKLLAVLPLDGLSSEVSSTFLESFRTGIHRRDEPRANASHAWIAYLNAVSLLLPRLDADSRVQILTDNLFPLTEKYLFPAEQQPAWSIGGEISILSKAYQIASLSDEPSTTMALAKEWERLAEILVAQLFNTPPPDVSPDFETSQKRIAEHGRRWFSVVGEIHKSSIGSFKYAASTGHADYTECACQKVIHCSVDLLKQRQFKPFGAAAIIHSALSQSTHLFNQGDTTVLEDLIPTSCSEEMTRMLSSPAAPYILSCISVLGCFRKDLYETFWTATVRCLLSMADTAKTDKYLTKLISDKAANFLAQAHGDVQAYISSRIVASAQNNADAWDLFAAAIQGDVLSESSLHEVSSQVVWALNKDNPASIKAVGIILGQNKKLFSANEALHLDLLSRLLSMMEIADTSTSSQANQLLSLLQEQLDIQPSYMSIIRENLERPGPSSLSVDTLIQQATVLSETGEIDLQQLFPDTNVWMQDLLLLLPNELSPALALTSSIGGAYLLPKSPHKKPEGRIRCDQRGLSVPARMGMYTVGLLSRDVGFDNLPQRFRAELLYLLYLVAEIASDQMNLVEERVLFQSLDDSSLVSEVEEYISSTRKTINRLFVESRQWKPGSGEKGLLDELVQTMIAQSKELTPLALYSARALSEILAAFADAHGHSAFVEAWITTLDVMKATTQTILPAMALLASYGDALHKSNTVSKLLNGLVSDIAAADPESEQTKLSLVLLNACSPIFELGQLPVANSRLVFAVQRITSWFNCPVEALGIAISTESCRALQRLLPCVGAVYGPYWNQTLDFCLSLWIHAAIEAAHNAAHNWLPCIHVSIKLVRGLKDIEDPNDDLADALDSYADALDEALLALLKVPRFEPISQAQELIDAVLCREACQIRVDHIKDLADLYGLVASESREIQTAGFNLLHRALPAAQEALSLDVLIEKKQVKLPDELMSRLLDAPTVDAYPEHILVLFPAAIRSYLLSWKLVFDAYQGSAYKLRDDYTEQLKTCEVIGSLMALIFDVLGHSGAHAINLDKESFSTDDIEGYDVKLGDALPEEKNMQWLLIHLFYLTLKYVPALFKLWFLDCRSKQTKIAIEPWMVKWFSPIIIHEALKEVEEWSKSQDISDPAENGLTIKVNYRQREITATYLIDDGGEEQSATILLQINANFPIGNVNVGGLNRVGCSERTWLSWIRTTQAIITMANGSLIDGLTAFRRNVVGALKGHVECAICYSFIALDKKMPDKKCGTCKNSFHRDCLFKWFSSANQNTCPLCRTRMDFAGKKKVWKQ